MQSAISKSDVIRQKITSSSLALSKSQLHIQAKPESSKNVQSSTNYKTYDPIIVINNKIELLTEEEIIAEKKRRQQLNAGIKELLSSSVTPDTIVIPRKRKQMDENNQYENDNESIEQISEYKYNKYDHNDNLNELKIKSTTIQNPPLHTLSKVEIIYFIV